MKIVNQVVPTVVLAALLGACNAADPKVGSSPVSSPVIASTLGPKAASKLSTCDPSVTGLERADHLRVSGGVRWVDGDTHPYRLVQMELYGEDTGTGEVSGEVVTFAGFNGLVPDTIDIASRCTNRPGASAIDLAVTAALKIDRQTGEILGSAQFAMHADRQWQTVPDIKIDDKPLGNVSDFGAAFNRDVDGESTPDGAIYSTRAYRLADGSIELRVQIVATSSSGAKQSITSVSVYR